jgi:nitrogen fixation-related uncharacterized protein
VTPTLAQGIEALGEPFRTIVTLLIVVVLLFAAIGITAFARGVAPEQHSDDSNRRFLRFQRRVFWGHAPLGRYRTKTHSQLNRLGIVMTWVVTAILVIALLSFLVASWRSG